MAVTAMGDERRSTPRAIVAPRVPDGETVPPVEEGGPFSQGFWPLAFRTRMVASVALAVAAAAVPAIGPNRFWIAGVVLFVGFAHNGLLDLLHHLRGRPSRLMIYLDPLVCVIFPLLEPRTWTPTLLVMMGGVALTAVAFGRRLALHATVMSVVAIGLTAFTVPVDDVVIGAIGFAIAATMITVAVGLVFDGEQRLRRRYGSLVENLDAIVWEADLDLTFTYVSAQAERISGWPAERWRTPGFWAEAIHPEDRAATLHACRRAIVRGVDHELEYRMLTVDGSVVHLHDVVTVITDGEGRPVHLQGVMVDVTPAAEAAGAMRYQALHDGLTGLANRSLLNWRLARALDEAERDGTAVALLVLDLDQFKEVNDTLGHHHGDRLLVELTRRLQHEMADCEVVARLGGDEFALLVVDTSIEQAVAIAQRARRALGEPVEIDALTLRINASVGIALSPVHAPDAETLVQRADVAMYLAKRTGSGHALYSAGQDRSSVRRLTLLGGLGRAIDEGELVLHYQPVIDVCTGHAVGAEALVRWQHPDHGLVPPGEFLELAQLAGLIGHLTDWVLERALDQAAAWTRAGRDLTVAANLSVRSLTDPNLAGWIAERLERRGLAPDRLILEITETELMEDPHVAKGVLHDLSELGVTASVDDFGTGYSSLAYLKDLPLGEVKIDRSFIMGVTVGGQELTIVRSMIELGHHLGFDVVAEGVEDLAVLEQLAELGCDRAQGFGFSPPLTAVDLEAWLDRRAASTAAPPAPIDAVALVAGDREPVARR